MKNRLFAELRPPSVHLLSLLPSLTLRPDRGTRDGKRVKGSPRGSFSSYVGSQSVSFGGSNSLKMQHARGGEERKREREKWCSSRRDEQVSAEKWVSRTGVSAGEYHIATLRRGLRCALRAEGRHTLAHTHANTHTCIPEGCAEDGVAPPRSNRVSAR